MFVVIIAYAIPIAVAVWIMITLYRIHSGQKVIQNRLEAIEHALRQSRNSGEPKE